MKKIFSLKVTLLIILGLIFTETNSLYAQGNEDSKKEIPPAKKFDIVQTNTKFRIDGIMDEDDWTKATVIDLPYEWFPGDNLPAPVKTECYITNDLSFLYIGFRCFDPEPANIRAHLMDRDNINTFVRDDHVLCLIDPFNDERRAFQFRVNPLGIQADANFSELEGYENFSWDAIWNSAGNITDFGYVVEIAIPFNQLRFPRGQEIQTWGFSAGRSYPRNVRHRIRSYATDRDKSCILCQVNKITGFEDISPGRNLEFDPTLIINRTDNQSEYPEGEIENGKLKVEPGITARWGITPNIMLNATINPDFSQVEADVAQLEVNTRFALRYPEKRPFFLEGADFFLTPLEAVFTRAVYDPVWGTKITAKTGKDAVGVFATEDRVNNIILPSNQGSQTLNLDEKVYGGVFRYRRDIGSGSTIGILYTGRTNKPYSNHLGGADAFIRLSNTNTLNIQYLHSVTEYSDTIINTFAQKTGDFSGNAISAEFQHFGRNLLYNFQYTDLSPDFRADAGFIPRVDLRRYTGMIMPIIYSKGAKWFERISFLLLGQRVNDYNNNLTDQIIQLGANYNGKLQSTISPGILFYKEFYSGVEYDRFLQQINFSLQPRGGIEISFFSRIGDYIDYSNSRMAYSQLLNPGIELGIGRHLNCNFNHINEKLSLNGEKIYTVNLSQARIIYNFNKRTFVRGIIQYQHISRNTDMYLFPVSEGTKTVFTQLLFSYKINPQTVLFLGYSDNNRGMPGIDITKTDRSFFFKFGYALVL